MNRIGYLFYWRLGKHGIMDAMVLECLHSWLSAIDLRKIFMRINIFHSS